MGSIFNGLYMIPNEIPLVITPYVRQSAFNSFVSPVNCTSIKRITTMAIYYSFYRCTWKV